MLDAPVSDICDSDEKLEWIHLAFIADSPFDVPLDLAFALLAVARKGELLLVAPEHARSRRPSLCARVRQLSLRKQVVQVDNLAVLLLGRPDNQEEAPVMLDHTIRDELGDTRIQRLAR